MCEHAQRHYEIKSDNGMTRRWTHNLMPQVWHSNPQLFRSITLCHHSITGWTVGVNTKACYSQIYPFTRGMSYSNILFVSELTSPSSKFVTTPLLRFVLTRTSEWQQPTGVTNFQGHSFKISLTHPLPSIIYSPLHVIRLSCLGSERPHGFHVLSHAPKNIAPLLITP